MSVAVRLPIFEGPLGLLLHLIRTHRIDIHDIPIARITEQYLEYLALLEALDLEVASEFLVMAATLMEMKSRCLLPRPEPEEEDEGPDPREELVRRLLEYEKIQAAAEQLRGLADEASRRFTRAPADLDPQAPLQPVSAADLFEALRRALSPRQNGNGRRPAVRIRREQMRLEDRIAQVWAALQVAGGKVPFSSLCSHRPSRRDIVVTFLAVLELLRQGRILAWQPGVMGEIWLEFSGGGEPDGREEQ